MRKIGTGMEREKEREREREREEAEWLRQRHNIRASRNGVHATAMNNRGKGGREREYARQGLVEAVGAGGKVYTL